MANSQWFAKAMKLWNSGAQDAESFHRVFEILRDRAPDDVLQTVVDLGLTLNTKHPTLLADRLILTARGNKSEFDTMIETVRDLPPAEGNRVGVTLWKWKDFRKATRVFEQVTNAYPKSVTAWTNLGINHNESGEKAMAEAAFRTALSIDPVSDSARTAYEHFKATENIIRSERQENCQK